MKIWGQKRSWGRQGIWCSGKKTKQNNSSSIADGFVWMTASFFTRFCFWFCVDIFSDELPLSPLLAQPFCFIGSYFSLLLDNILVFSLHLGQNSGFIWLVGSPLLLLSVEQFSSILAHHVFDKSPMRNPGVIWTDFDSGSKKFSSVTWYWCRLLVKVCYFFNLYCWVKGKDWLQSMLKQRET